MNHDLFYFNSKKQGELDFVVEKDGEFLPIEVKSGKDYERHRALCNVMENEEYAVPHAFVLCLDIIDSNLGSRKRGETRCGSTSFTIIE